MTSWLSFFASTAYAATSLQPDAGKSGSLISIKDALTSLFPTVITILAVIAGILAAIYLVWSGIQYIMAGNSPEKAKAARTGIFNALIGIIVVVAAYGVIRLATTIGGQVNGALGGSGVTTIANDSGGGGGTNKPDGGTDTGSSGTGGTGSSGSVPDCSSTSGIGNTQLNGIFSCTTLLVNGSADTKWYNMVAYNSKDGQYITGIDSSDLNSFETNSSNTVSLNGNTYWFVSVSSSEQKWCRDTQNCITGDDLSAMQDLLANQAAACNNDDVLNSLLTSADPPIDLINLFFQSILPF